MREQTNAAVNHKFDVRWYFKNKIQRDHSQAKKKKNMHPIFVANIV